MNKYQVSVIGGKPPQRPKGLLAALRRAIARAISALPIGAITIVLAGGVGFVSFIGTPHVGWDYGCSHAMRGIGTCRSASWCSYYGIQGRRIEIPRGDERCKIVALLPLDWNKIIEKVWK